MSTRRASGRCSNGSGRPPCGLPSPAGVFFPMETSRLAADLATNGELPHAASFRVRDLAAAERHVERMGVGVVDRAGDTLTLDPADCFGAVWSFVEQDIPNDPRGPHSPALTMEDLQ